MLFPPRRFATKRQPGLDRLPPEIVASSYGSDFGESESRFFESRSVFEYFIYLCIIDGSPSVKAFCDLIYVVPQVSNQPCGLTQLWQIQFQDVPVQRHCADICRSVRHTRFLHLVVNQDVFCRRRLETIENGLLFFPGHFSLLLTMRFVITILIILKSAKKSFVFQCQRIEIDQTCWWSAGAAVWGCFDSDIPMTFKQIQHRIQFPHVAEVPSSASLIQV